MRKMRGRRVRDISATKRERHRGALRYVWSKNPLAPIIWFEQDGTKDHIRRMKHDTRKVWDEWGGHCSFCGKSEELCKILNIGLQAQHVQASYVRRSRRRPGDSDLRALPRNDKAAVA